MPWIFRLTGDGLNRYSTLINFLVSGVVSPARHGEQKHGKADFVFIGILKVVLHLLAKILNPYSNTRTL